MHGRSWNSYQTGESIRLVPDIDIIVNSGRRDVIAIISHRWNDQRIVKRKLAKDSRYFIA